MSKFLEGLEQRVMFSLSPVAAAEIKALHEQGKAIQTFLTDSKKVGTDDFKALVLTLKANGVYKEDKTLLATLSKESAANRAVLTKQSNKLVLSLSNDASQLVNAGIALAKHTTSKSYSSYLKKYSTALTHYDAVEGVIATTLDGLRDTLGSADITNLTAIANANAGNSAVTGEVDSIIAATNTGNATFDAKVADEVSDATTVVESYLS